MPRKKSTKRRAHELIYLPFAPMTRPGKFWVRAGWCAQCLCAAWIDLDGRGAGPHVQIDACEHLRDTLAAYWRDPKALHDDEE